MGRFKYLVDSLASMESFRAKYHIPLEVGLEYCPQTALSRDLSFLSSLFIFGSMSSRIMFIVGLTMFAFLNVFVDKDHVSPKLSLVNVPGLKFLLRLEIFVSEDNQLQAAHLILGYKPLSRIYQDVGQALRAGNPRLARIDVSKPGFLARRDLPPVVLPAQQNPP